MNAPPVRWWVAAGRRQAIVLGRGQRDRPVASPLPVRRRASGGGAVLEGPWLLRVALRVPRDHPLAARGPVALARWTGGVHADWLQSLGVPAHVHAGPTSEHWACFGGRGPGEVLVGERKLVGIAQAWHRSFIILQAATLLHPVPWALLCDAFLQPAAAPLLAAGTTSVEACLGTPLDATCWETSLRGALARTLLAPAQLAPPAPS